MKKITIIYDDSIKVSPRIRTIIGKNSYGDIVLKRKSLFKYFEEIVGEAKINAQIIKMKELQDIDSIVLNNIEDKIILHYFANNPVTKRDEFEIFLKKLEFVNENFMVYSNNLIGLIFKNGMEYIKFLDNYKFRQDVEEYTMFDKMHIDACLDISVYQNLLSYISGGFDARYFNSISGDEYTVVKCSKDKKKIKMEYTYYNLLPDEMKKWMVMPYNYQESSDVASYTMERMPMTDIAIRWTHGAVQVPELTKILDKTFYYIKERPIKKVEAKEYLEASKKLYLGKLEERVKDLKRMPEYKTLQLLLQSGTEFSDIDEVIDLYKDVYNKISVKDKNNVLVIGHGDLFFANMLYSKELNMLKLIDPKGALEEKDLWMHPYYDIAKLSHSICGKYDFFNVDGFSIDLNKNMKFELNVNFDNKEYVSLFKKYLEENNFDYELVRLYEASLFLSMLPLHIDNPHKVFGFLLNGINILKELR